MLDTYNQQIHNFVSCTIRTNINTANHHFIVMEEPICVAMCGRNPDNPSERGKSDGRYKQRLEPNMRGVANTITSVQKDCMVAEPQVMTPKRTEFGKAIRNQYESGDVKMSRHDMTTMVPREDGVSNTLTSVQKDNYLTLPHADVKYRIRKLTPRECFRLMGVDDADIDKIQAAGISNSQQYKMVGNSIVVDTIAHILRKLYIDKGKKQAKQLTLF